MPNSNLEFCAQIYKKFWISYSLRIIGQQVVLFQTHAMLTIASLPLIYSVLVCVNVCVCVKEREDEMTCLWRPILLGFKSVFVHNPISLLSIWSPSFVENKGFPHPDQFCLVVHWFVSTRCFPKPSHGGSVGPCPSRILLVFVAEEVPLVLLFIPDPASLCPFMSINQSDQDSC